MSNSYGRELNKFFFIDDWKWKVCSNFVDCVALVRNLKSFPFLRRPYKIILQKGKNNQMKVLEQCIESGRPDGIYFQAARS